MSSGLMERTYEAPSNEAPHMILGYHQGRLVTHLQHHFNFLVNGNRLSQEPACRFVFSFVSAQLPQSAYSIIFTIDKAASELEEPSGKDAERIPSLRFLTSNPPTMPVSFN